jgi:hypothetical protein
MSKFQVGDRVFHVGWGVGMVFQVDDSQPHSDRALSVGFFAPNSGKPCTVFFTLDGRFFLFHTIPQILTLEEARVKGYEIPKVKVKKIIKQWSVVASNGVITHTFDCLKKAAQYQGLGDSVVELTGEYEVEE